MGRLLKKGAVGLGLLALAAAAWIGADLLVKVKFQDNLQDLLDRFEAHAEAIDEFDIIRLDYDRDGGTVDYRFRYRPDPEDALYESFAELLGPASPRVSVNGQMEVEDYGLVSWVVGRPIRATGTLPWAESVASSLPGLEYDYWTSFEIGHGSDGDTFIQLKGVGYDGDLLMAGQERIGEVYWAEWKASFWLDSKGVIHDLNGELPRAWVSVPGDVDLQVAGLRLRGDEIVIEGSRLFASDSELALERIQAQLYGDNFELNGFRLAHVTREMDRRALINLALALGETRVGESFGLQELTAELHLNIDAGSLRDLIEMEREVAALEHSISMTIDAIPLGAEALQELEVPGQVSQEMDIPTPDGDTRTIEFINFQSENVVPLLNEDGVRENRQLGPSFDFRLMDRTGHGLYYRNYQRPALQEGAMYFLSGVRESPADEFHYLFLPADADDSLERFRTYLAMLHNPDVRNEIARQVARDDDTVEGSQNQAIAQTSAELMGLFAQGGYPAVHNEIERRVPAERIEEVRDLMIRILHAGLQGLYMEVLQDEGVVSIQEEEQRFLEDTISAINAISLYQSPFFFHLKDFEGPDTLYQRWLMETVTHGVGLNLRELRVIDVDGNEMDASLNLETGEIPQSAWERSFPFSYPFGDLNAFVDQGLIRSVVRADMALREPSRPAAHTDREAEEVVATLMQGVRDFPLVTVKEDRVFLDFMLDEGAIVAGGEPTMPILDLMTLLSDFDDMVQPLVGPAR